MVDITRPWGLESNKNHSGVWAPRLPVIWMEVSSLVALGEEVSSLVQRNDRRGVGRQEQIV